MTYRIVVGMDLRESGDVALEEALRLATRIGDSEVHPVFALSADPAVEVSAFDVMNAHLERALAQLEQRAAAVAARVEARTKALHHVRFGDPVAVLQQVARDYDADLIVVGTHGRRGVERLLLGSVASDLVRVARVPVTVARRKDWDGIERTPEMDAPRADDDWSRARVISDAVVYGKRDSHIAGLV